MMARDASQQWICKKSQIISSLFTLKTELYFGVLRGWNGALLLLPWILLCMAFFDFLPSHVKKRWVVSVLWLCCIFFAKLAMAVCTTMLILAELFIRWARLKCNFSSHYDSPLRIPEYGIFSWRPPSNVVEKFYCLLQKMLYWGSTSCSACHAQFSQKICSIIIMPHTKILFLYNIAMHSLWWNLKSICWKLHTGTNQWNFGQFQRKLYKNWTKFKAQCGFIMHALYILFIFLVKNKTPLR